MAETADAKIPQKKFTLKVEAVNMNDLVIATNDTKTANALCEWYTSVTGNKIKPGKESKLIKSTNYLDNARKDSALGSHWIVALGDKLMELGYQPGFGSIKVGATDQCFIFFSQ